MQKKNEFEGMVWRVALTIGIVAAFLVGSLLYVGFYAEGYSLFQKIIVVVVALVVALAIIAIAWTTWAGKYGYMDPKQWEKHRQ